MRSVREVFLEKIIVFRVNDPYLAATEIKDIVASFGQVRERVNEFLTDGPSKIARLSFDLVEHASKSTQVILSFDIYGEANMLGEISVRIMGAVDTLLETPEGIFSESFHDFYLVHYVKDIKKTAAERANVITKTIETRVRRHHNTVPASVDKSL